MFYTIGDEWLTEPVCSFIKSTGAVLAIDPFAGAGHLLHHVAAEFGLDTAGYELNPILCQTHGWLRNDSLISIPAQSQSAICITNPPFKLIRSGSRRQGTSDLYLTAIHRCLAAFGYVVAILPERLIHDCTTDLALRLVLVDVIETDLFCGTEFPVCVACWGSAVASPDFMLYKNGEFIGLWKAIRAAVPQVSVDGITFNEPDGQIGLIGYDGHYPHDRIIFCEPSIITTVDVDDRHRTKIGIRPPIDAVVARRECNRILNEIRQKTSDLVLFPFQRNNRAGTRRRRLSYAIARRIVGKAIMNLS